MDIADPKTDGTTTEESAPETPPDTRTVPLAALEAARKRAQAAETRAAKLEADQAAAAARAAEEAGKHRELYEGLKPKHEQTVAELDALKAREAQRAEKLAAKNAGRIEALPEHLKAIVPTYDDPEMVAEWLDKATPLVAEKTYAAGTRGGGGASGGKQPIPEECIAQARANDRDPEWWFQNVWLKRKRKQT